MNVGESMYCKYCGTEKAVEDAAYCEKCGKKYDNGETASAQPMSQPRPTLGVPPSPDEKEVFGFPKIHLCMVVLLQAVTFNIYSIVWFMKRRDAVNKLNSEQKISEGVLIAIACVMAASVMFGLFSAIFHDRAGKLFGGLCNLARFISGISSLVMAFKYRKILREHLREIRPGVTLEGFASSLWTVLFGIIYLQHKINQL